MTVTNVSVPHSGPLAVRVSIGSMSHGGPAEAGDVVPLIAGLKMQAEPGEIHALLGPTAAGKTTLLRIVAGLEGQYDGDVTVGDRPVTHPSRRVQLMFQDHRLLPWLSVADNVAFGLPESDNDLVAHWLRIVQLTDRRDAWPKTLSGGESSRVALARAFVSSPSVLLLDEPFAALDVIVRAELRDRLIQALALNPATVLMVSHSVEDAVMLADVVHVLRTRPMRVGASFHVEHPRPRPRGDTALLRLASDVYSVLEEARKT